MLDKLNHLCYTMYASQARGVEPRNGIGRNINAISFAYGVNVLTNRGEMWYDRERNGGDMKIEIDTDQMQAGVWLDALVAEKVMGWKEVCPIDNPYVHSYGTNAEDIKAVELPHYSSDLNAAWVVADRITTYPLVGYGVCLVINFFSNSCIHVFFRLSDNDERKTNNPLFLTKAATLPLAICRVALKVVDNG